MPKDRWGMDTALHHGLPNAAAEKLEMTRVALQTWGPQIVWQGLWRFPEAWSDR
jgi:hypothetical protein